MALPEDIRLTIRFDDHPPLSALDLSSFIFDLNRIYVAAYREISPDGAAPGRFRGFGRNSYRLPKAVQLNVQRIRFESPGLIELAANAGHVTQIIGAAGAVAVATWAVVQSVEKLVLLPYARQKARLEAEKLRIEVDRMVSPDRSATLLASPEAQSALRQLERNPLKPSDFDLFVTPDDRI